MSPSIRTPKEVSFAGPSRDGNGRSPARSRALWGTISRQQVIEAAVRIVNRGDYERMTVRSLASELDVSPMALYRHVRDKDDLLVEVVDRLFAPRWQPRARRTDWRAYTAEAAGQFRRFLIGQPAALYVHLQHPVGSPTSEARMAAMTEVLRSAGFDDHEAGIAYAAVHTYTLGFAALEASRARAASPATPPAGAAGSSKEFNRKLISFTTPRQFKEGLSFLLDGIESRRHSGPLPQ